MIIFGNKCVDKYKIKKKLLHLVHLSNTTNFLLYSIIKYLNRKMTYLSHPLFSSGVDGYPKPNMNGSETAHRENCPPQSANSFLIL